MNMAYWIRTDPATGCHNFETIPDARQGILWYGGGSHPPIPTTTAHAYNNTCSDMLDLVPVVPWTIDEPPPIIPMVKYTMAQSPIETMSVTIGQWNLSAVGDDPEVTVNFWQFLNDTLWVNYAEPTVNHLDPPYNSSEVIYLAAEAQPAQTTWNYMLIIGGNIVATPPVTGGNLAPNAHPVSFSSHPPFYNNQAAPYTNWYTLRSTSTATTSPSYNTPPTSTTAAKT